MNFFENKEWRRLIGGCKDLRCTIYDVGLLQLLAVAKATTPKSHPERSEGSDDLRL